MPKLYGVTSKIAIERGVRTVIYKHIDGHEVELIAVCNDPECAGFLWPDKQLLGEVTEYIRQGKPASGLRAELEKLSRELTNNWLNKLIRR